METKSPKHNNQYLQHQKQQQPFYSKNPDASGDSSCHGDNNSVTFDSSSSPLSEHKQNQRINSMKISESEQPQQKISNFIRSYNTNRNNKRHSLAHVYTQNNNSIFYYQHCDDDDNNNNTNNNEDHVLSNKSSDQNHQHYHPLPTPRTSLNISSSTILKSSTFLNKTKTQVEEEELEEEEEEVEDFNGKKYLLFFMLQGETCIVLFCFRFRQFGYLHRFKRIYKDY